MIPELTVFFSAMVPMLDLKLAIPLGHKLGLAAPSIFLFAAAGAILPAAITLAVIGPISQFLMKRSKTMNRFFTHLFEKTRKHHSKKFNRYGAIFLFSFVALPIPGSGSTSGSLIAFLFGVDYWKALSIISMGVVSASILLLAGYESVFAILDIFS